MSRKQRDYSFSRTLVFALLSCATCISADAFGEETAPGAAPEVKPKEDFLAKAQAEYRRREYDDAANDLGAALPDEFNNPVLHYYYANCMVHLRHKDAAIREYRIAYALQPIGTIGDYCKLCLDRFGIDAEGKKSSEPKTPPAKVDVKKSASPAVPEPPTAAELAALKAHPKDGSTSSVERQKSVDNLRDLMEQKKMAHGAPLPSTVGTNLYVRNYKEAPGGAKLSDAEAPRAQSAATPAPAANAPANPSPPKKKLGLWWW